MCFMGNVFLMGGRAYSLTPIAINCIASSKLLGFSETVSSSFKLGSRLLIGWMS